MTAWTLDSSINLHVTQMVHFSFDDPIVRQPLIGTTGESYSEVLQSTAPGNRTAQLQCAVTTFSDVTSIQTLHESSEVVDFANTETNLVHSVVVLSCSAPQQVKDFWQMSITLVELEAPSPPEP